MPSLHSLFSLLRARTLRRRKVSPKAKALLRDDAGTILLIKHPLEGYWRLPGGFVRMDESAYGAVARAVQELTGLVVLNPQPIARIDESHFRTDAMYGDYFQMYATLFLVTRWEGDLRPAGADWRVEFFSEDKLPLNLHPEVKQALVALAGFEDTGQIGVY